MKVWAWLAVLGMTLSLTVLFSIAYTLGYTVDRTGTLLRLLKSTFWLPMSIVNLNILLWAIISYWLIKSGNAPFSPFGFKGMKEELMALLIGFAGLWALNLALKGLKIEIPQLSYKPNPLVAVDTAIFGALEEVTWRAFVLNAIGGPLGLIASSFGFGLHHLGSSWQHALVAFVAGLILGGVYMKTGAFWGGFFAHGLYNFSVVLWEMLKAKGG